MKLLVTGGAGFIGSTFVRLALRRWPDATVVVLDKLTYAGNLANLDAVQNEDRFCFLHGDIADPHVVRSAMKECTHVLNFAAETHVDRSILNAVDFVRTDVEGTRVLLDSARELSVGTFLQVSTDEVYGDIPSPNRVDEDAPLKPNSPYSASKAGGDLMVQAYHATYGLPTLITRGSNTYGPYQYPEKLVPLFIINALEALPLPVYGDGKQMRDWLFVEDHCAGIATVLESGVPGEIYNVGAGKERPNLDVIDRIIELTAGDRSLIQQVLDRPGHDRRYALRTDKLRSLGWNPLVNFDAGMQATVSWYRENRLWWQSLRDGSYREYYQRQYGGRLKGGMSS